MASKTADSVLPMLPEATCARHAALPRAAEPCPYCLVAQLQEDRDDKQAEIHRTHQTLGHLRVEIEELRRQVQQAQVERDQAVAEVGLRSDQIDPGQLLDDYRAMVEQKLAAEADCAAVRAEVEDLREELAVLDAVREQVMALTTDAALALAGLAAAKQWRPQRFAHRE